MTFPPGLRALNHPEYRRLYLTQLVSQVGGWIQAVAQSWLVLQLTGSPLKLGLISTLQFAPVLLFSIVAGAAADRLHKRRVLIASQTTYLCQAVLLAVLVWTGAVQYWHVCALALILGFVNAIDQPVRQSFVVELVGREDVGNAVALNSASFNAARIVGPAVAGVLIARFGVAPAFALNALGFAAMIVVLLKLRAHGLPAPRTGTSITEEIAAGVHFALKSPVILVVLGLVAVVSLCVFNFSVYVPLLARQVLHLGAEGFGFLMASLGVGAVAGALTVGARRQLSARRHLRHRRRLARRPRLSLRRPPLLDGGAVPLHHGLLRHHGDGERQCAPAGRDAGRAARPRDGALRAAHRRRLPHRRLHRGRRLRALGRVDGVLLQWRGRAHRACRHLPRLEARER